MHRTRQAQIFTRKRNELMRRAFKDMSLDTLESNDTRLRRPIRLQRDLDTKTRANTVDVGPGTKWNNPIKKRDVDTLLSSEPDIEAAVAKGGWKAGAVLLYRDYLLEEDLDPTELQGKDLTCTCKLSEPCHADVLLELANR
jgi:hypothetical protein